MYVFGKGGIALPAASLLLLWNFESRAFSTKSNFITICYKLLTPGCTLWLKSSSLKIGNKYPCCLSTGLHPGFPVAKLSHVLVMLKIAAGLVITSNCSSEAAQWAAVDSCGWRFDSVRFGYRCHFWEMFVRTNKKYLNVNFLWPTASI